MAFWVDDFPFPKVGYVNSLEGNMTIEKQPVESMYLQLKNAEFLACHLSCRLEKNSKKMEVQVRSPPWRSWQAVDPLQDGSFGEN